MASAVGELGAILRGGEPGTQQEAADGGAAAAAAAAAAAGQPGVDISKLSQLSDFANKELQKDGTQPGAPGLPPGGVQFSQESLLSAPDNPLAFQAPSQPDIPAPSLPPSQAMSQQLPGDGAQPPADDPQKAMAAAVAAATMPAMNFDPQQLMQSMALMPTLMGNMDWSHLAVSGRKGACWRALAQARGRGRRGEAGRQQCARARRARLCTCLLLPLCILPGGSSSRVCTYQAPHLSLRPRYQRLRASAV